MKQLRKFSVGYNLKARFDATRHRQGFFQLHIFVLNATSARVIPNIAVLLLHNMQYFMPDPRGVDIIQTRSKNDTSI